MAWRKHGFVLCLVWRVRVQFIDLGPERVMGIVRMAVVLGVVQSLFLVAFLVLACKASFHVGSDMCFMVVRGRVLCVSWHEGSIIHSIWIK